VSRGAKLADSAADAVAASPLVVFCVTDYRAARELLEPLGATLEGRVLVNLTSGTSQDARQTAEWAARHGGVYLDGAIIAIPEAIGTPEAVVFYSGPRSEFDQHEPTLRALDADLPRFVKSLADRSVAAGQGGSSYAAMVELFRKPSAASG
jgi:3-hydroxyisobutyrate dehydrogenase-like beta-hydroxyacid dehydrogenase